VEAMSYQAPCRGIFHSRSESHRKQDQCFQCLLETDQRIPAELSTASPLSYLPYFICEKNCNYP
jgi:hypothetical protein